MRVSEIRVKRIRVNQGLGVFFILFVFSLKVVVETFIANSVQYNIYKVRIILRCAAYDA